ncbi:HIT domain-containing protein [Streptomyces collinus]|uniref:HIT domain-containing protein n=1 Tax=Streptomyces collinus TaxID=42684 RepID=UPI0036E9EBA4
MGPKAQDHCWFCKIAAKEIPAEVVSETGTTLAFKEPRAQAPTRLIVMPKGHYATGADLASAPDTLAELMRETGNIAEAAGVAESGCRTVFNTGVNAGQKISHAHAVIVGGRVLDERLGQSAGCLSDAASWNRAWGRVTRDRERPWWARCTAVLCPVAAAHAGCARWWRVVPLPGARVYGEQGALRAVHHARRPEILFRRPGSDG